MVELADRSGICDPRACGVRARPQERENADNCVRAAKKEGTITCGNVVLLRIRISGSRGRRRRPNERPLACPGCAGNAGQMSRRLITLTAALLGSMATCIAGSALAARSPGSALAARSAQSAPPAAPRQPDQDRPAPFRVSVDVVAVDVQVIDRSASRFPISARKSSRSRSTAAAAASCRPSGSCSDARRGAPSVTSPAARVGARPRDHARGRLHQLRCDRIARTSSGGAAIRQATVARRFRRPLRLSQRRQARSRRRDHAAVLRALDNVAGQRDLAEMSQFHVRPSEIDRSSRASCQPWRRSAARRDRRPGMRRSARPVLPAAVHHRRDRHGALLRGPGDREPRHAATRW